MTETSSSVDSLASNSYYGDNNITQVHIQDNSDKPHSKVKETAVCAIWTTIHQGSAITCAYASKPSSSGVAIALARSTALLNVYKRSMLALAVNQGCAVLLRGCLSHHLFLSVHQRISWIQHGTEMTCVKRNK